MPVEYWMLGILLIGLAAAFGFAAGRMTAPREKQFQSLQNELDETREELQYVRSQVNAHLEQSGRLFGTLAQDYRALFEHYADTARRLGFSDAEARDLLDKADRHLPRAAGESGEGADDRPSPSGHAASGRRRSSVWSDAAPSGDGDHTESTSSEQPTDGEQQARTDGEPEDRPVR
ncbi:MAG: DUF1043 family protein [Ectothiorhodospiraceae bacterium]|jgi:uncharacterized membrane-anchored protein YhcB (DUF1043 family)